MARLRERGWPGDPEPLPAEVVDDHTHLDSVLGWSAEGWPDDEPADAPTAGGARVEPPSFGPDAGRPGPGASGSADLDAQLRRAAAVGVARAVHVACDLDALPWALAAVARREELVAAVAIHPNEAVLHAGVREVAPDGLDPDPRPRHATPLDQAIAQVAAAARSTTRVRAIGETGLDHFRAGERGRAVQRKAFRAHVALAKELDLALQIHDRDAHREVVEVLLADGAPRRTVFHCFSGDVELARTCAEHGWYCSFAGPVSFPANDALRAAARELPEHLLLAETDAPYLTVHPFRGRPNAPYLLPGTVRTLARVREADLAAFCTRLTRTTEAVYGTW